MGAAADRAANAITHHLRGAQMSKIAAISTALMLALTGSAFAQDYSSPDAKSPAPTRDYRSPDAKPVSFRAPVPLPDFSSPDARPSGRFVGQAPPSTSDGGNSSPWLYLALGVAFAGLAGLALILTQRRSRRQLAIGS
jgi:hypothetical protein